MGRPWSNEEVISFGEKSKHILVVKSKDFRRSHFQSNLDDSDFLVDITLKVMSGSS